MNCIPLHLNILKTHLPANRNRARRDIYQKKGNKRAVPTPTSTRISNVINIGGKFDSKQINSYYEWNTTFETSLGLYPTLHITCTPNNIMRWLSINHKKL